MTGAGGARQPCGETARNNQGLELSDRASPWEATPALFFATGRISHSGKPACRKAPRIFSRKEGSKTVAGLDARVACTRWRARASSGLSRLLNKAFAFTGEA
jgi:hypothetical protein